MPCTPLIKLDNITVRVGNRWLFNGLSWQINTGENWVIWGANGVGKTTLARTLAGRTAVVKGTIRRLNPAVAAPKAVAMISPDQQQQLYHHEQMLAEMADFSGRPDMATTVAQVLKDMVSDTISLQVQDTIERMGLQSLLSRPVLALSAGEMRKLLVARALIQKPQLLILDEPFNGLDTAAQTQLRETFSQLGTNGVQMVLITHRLTDIPSVFTRLIHLKATGPTWIGDLAGFFSPPTVKPPMPQNIHRPTKAKAPGDGIPLIQMKQVSVRFNRQQVLHGINWTMRAGENWALTGPNGAGKSTLLKLITGDNLQGYANKLILFGHPKGTGQSVWQIKRRIGYVADDLQLRYQKKMTVFDVVCSGFFDSVGLYHRCSATQKQTADKWLTQTSTQDLAHRFFSHLSYGQQRMVLIVRAMVKMPRLLILDEPCNGLDTANRKRLLDILDIIGHSGHTNLLYVSHRPDEIPVCITHHLCLEAGRVTKNTAQT